jgi:capsid protein
VRTLGRDPEEVAAEIKADQDLFDRLGVKLDSDGRYPANESIAGRLEAQALPNTAQKAR